MSSRSPIREYRLRSSLLPRRFDADSGGTATPKVRQSPRRRLQQEIPVAPADVASVPAPAPQAPPETLPAVVQEPSLTLFELLQVTNQLVGAGWPASTPVWGVTPDGVRVPLAAIANPQDGQ